MRPLLLLWWLAISLANSVPTYAQNSAPLPHSTVAKGKNQVARAWLANPTARYQHFVLGDPFEAESLLVEMRGGKILKYDLPNHLVFEDRQVRLADLDNDGKDELIVVMSSVLQGAALAVFKADQNLELFAQTPHIGLPFRWLNPAGIADFNGDGKLEIALVQKPHLTKRLEFWQMDGANLIRIGTIDGFSNHRNGSRNQKMSMVFDVDKNGVADLLLPGPDRRTINAVSFSPQLNVVKSWQLPFPVDGNFVLETANGNDALKFTLQGGAEHVVNLQ